MGKKNSCIMTTYPRIAVKNCVRLQAEENLRERKKKTETGANKRKTERKKKNLILSTFVGNLEYQRRHA